jgi:hypothetical protein
MQIFPSITSFRMQRMDYNVTAGVFVGTDSRTLTGKFHAFQTMRSGGPSGRRDRNPGTRRPVHDTAVDTQRTATARGCTTRKHGRAKIFRTTCRAPKRSSHTCPDCVAETGSLRSRRVVVTSSSDRAAQHRPP